MNKLEEMYTAFIDDAMNEFCEYIQEEYGLGVVEYNKPDNKIYGYTEDHEFSFIFDIANKTPIFLKDTKDIILEEQSDIGVVEVRFDVIDKRGIRNIFTGYDKGGQPIYHYIKDSKKEYWIFQNTICNTKEQYHIERAEYDEIPPISEVITKTLEEQNEKH